jgi:hypothetical protein
MERGSCKFIDLISNNFDYRHFKLWTIGIPVIREEVKLWQLYNVQYIWGRIPHKQKETLRNTSLHRWEK